MQLSHTPAAIGAAFDDPNLIASAGLVPLIALAESAGLLELVSAHVGVPTDKGANADLETMSLVSGMCAGADSIKDMSILRHGAMGKTFAHCYAPSTLGSFLRQFTFGHVRQLDAVASRFLAALAEQAPLLAGIDDLALVDLDARVDRGPWPWEAGRVVRLHRRPRTQRRSGDRHRSRRSPGHRRDPAAQGLRRFRPRRRPDRGRRPADRPPPAIRKRDRDGRPARRLRVLRPPDGPCRSERRGAGQHHRPPEHAGTTRNRVDPGRCVDHDRVPARHPRRGHRRLGITGRGRRDPLHRLRIRQGIRAGPRPPRRAPHPRPQPSRRPRPSIAGCRLAVPRVLHHRPRRCHGHRGRGQNPPRPRDH